MDERGKIELLERAQDAWNRGDLEGVTAEFSEDFVWDMRRSGVPGETELHRGRDAYVQFARRWQEMLGATQLVLEEAKELPDGRVFVVYRTTGTGALSGAAVELQYVQIHSFEGDRTTGAEVFRDMRLGRAAAGLDPDEE